jgi:surface antigen
MKKRLTIFAILILTLTACASQVGPRENTGTLLGAGTGALIGSQFGHGGGRFAAIALGTIAGALIGQDIGHSLDEADQMYMKKNAQSSLEKVPSHQTSTWVNPDTGHSGSITPTRTYQNASGEYCREYQQKVIINGVEQEAYGQACRQPDGTWKIASTPPETGSKEQVVKRYVMTDPYPVDNWTTYYSGYSYPGIFWPFTSISLSYGNFSSHNHFHGRGHGGRRGHWEGEGFGHH